MVTEDSKCIIHFESSFNLHNFKIAVGRTYLLSLINCPVRIISTIYRPKIKPYYSNHLKPHQSQPAECPERTLDQVFQPPHRDRGGACHVPKEVDQTQGCTSEKRGCQFSNLMIWTQLISVPDSPIGNPRWLTLLC